MAPREGTRFFSLVCGSWQIDCTPVDGPYTDLMCVCVCVRIYICILFNNEHCCKLLAWKGVHGICCKKTCQETVHISVCAYAAFLEFRVCHPINFPVPHSGFTSCSTKMKPGAFSIVFPFLSWHKCYTHQHKHWRYQLCKERTSFLALMCRF